MRSGGCLCGAVRFRITREPVSKAYCHCRMCQRWTGAVLIPWVTVKAKAFEVTEGELTWYASSERAERGFCGRCATPIAFRTRDRGAFVDLTTASFDDLAGLEPDHSIWTASRVPWVACVDAHLPQHADAGPDWSA